MHISGKNKGITEINLNDLFTSKEERLALSYVKSLDLSCNNLRVINSLNSLLNLSVLNLSNNVINNVINLPSRIKTLDLSNNKLKSLNISDNALPLLEEINISSNSFKQLTDLSTLTFLRVLKASHNNIESLKGLSRLNALQTFDLEANPISRVNELNEIRNLPNLSSLNLLSCPVSKSSRYRSTVVFVAPHLTCLDGRCFTADFVPSGAQTINTSVDASTCNSEDAMDLPLESALGTTAIGRTSESASPPASSEHSVSVCSNIKEEISTAEPSDESEALAEPNTPPLKKSPKQFPSRPAPIPFSAKKKAKLSVPLKGAMGSPLPHSEPESARSEASASTASFIDQKIVKNGLKETRVLISKHLVGQVRGKTAKDAKPRTLSTPSNFESSLKKGATKSCLVSKDSLLIPRVVKAQTPESALSRENNKAFRSRSTPAETHKPRALLLPSLSPTASAGYSAHGRGPVLPYLPSVPTSVTAETLHVELNKLAIRLQESDSENIQLLRENKALRREVSSKNQLMAEQLSQAEELRSRVTELLRENTELRSKAAKSSKELAQTRKNYYRVHRAYEDEIASLHAKLEVFSKTAQRRFAAPSTFSRSMTADETSVISTEAKPTKSRSEYSDGEIDSPQMQAISRPLALASVDRGIDEEKSSEKPQTKKDLGREEGGYSQLYSGKGHSQGSLSRLSSIFNTEEAEVFNANQRESSKSTQKHSWVIASS